MEGTKHLQSLGFHLKVKYLYVSIPLVKWKDPGASWFSSILFSFMRRSSRKSLCSKETFLAKGETRLLNVTIKCEPCCRCSSLMGGQESHREYPAAEGGRRGLPCLRVCAARGRGLRPGRRSCPLSLWRKDRPALA